MKRIVIIGSGKTTLGKQISERLHVPHSLFLWLIQTYPRRRREYPLLFQHPEYAHLNVIHLYSQRETDQWFAQLTTDP